MARDFRFGLSLRDGSDASAVRACAQRAEDAGYDILLIRDHLGAPAPFPTLATAAAATKTLHVGTFVLNAGFYRPALLARDVATTRDVTGGRLELGLGAGSVREEFEAAGIAFPAPRERVEHLRRVADYLRDHVPDVPILIGGNGNRVLTLAAERAHIVGLAATGTTGGVADPIAERIAFIRNAAPARFDDLELNTAITAMPIDDSGIPDVAIPHRSSTAPSVGVLSGTSADMADQIRRYRDGYGITYLTVQQRHGEAFGKVIALLRSRSHDHPGTPDQWHEIGR